MDIVAVIASSTLVSAIVGAVAAYVSQRALAKRQAGLTYEYAARTRLYQAIGPLRFQLLVACRDVVRRVSGHTRQRSWELAPNQYYGSSTIYRLLRPLAVCTLIERQMNAADFSVDPASIRLLRFEVGAYRLLTNREPLKYHEKLDWARQTQHVLRDNLRRAAVRLLAEDGGGASYVMDYSEFLATFPDPAADEALAPMAGIFAAAGDSLRNNPVFWVRIVGYAYLCQQFIENSDTAGGFARRPVEVESLLADLDDPYIPNHVYNQAAIYQHIIDERL